MIGSVIPAPRLVPRGSTLRLREWRLAPTPLVSIHGKLKWQIWATAHFWAVECLGTLTIYIFNQL